MRGLLFTAGMAALLTAAPALAINTPTQNPPAYADDAAALDATVAAQLGDAVRPTRDWDETGLTVIAAGDIAAGRVMPTGEGYRTAEAKPISQAFQTAGVAPIKSANAATARGDASRLISRLPEPATWGMMVLGFGAVGFAIRRGIRRSEARFTARLARIASGEEA